jgi:hypothetical protein
MVRAKFKVQKVERILSIVPVVNPETGNTEYMPGEIQSILMSPVSGNGDPSHENTKFWQASPSGQLTIGCANLEAAKQFELGKEYYVDFTPAE